MFKFPVHDMNVSSDCLSADVNTKWPWFSKGWFLELNSADTSSAWYRGSTDFVNGGTLEDVEKNIKATAKLITEDWGGGGGLQ